MFSVTSKVRTTSLLPVASWTGGGGVNLKPQFDRSSQTEPLLGCLLHIPCLLACWLTTWRTPGTSAANVHEALQAHYKDRQFVLQTRSWNRWLLLIQYVERIWKDVLIYKIYGFGFDILMILMLMCSIFDLLQSSLGAVFDQDVCTERTRLRSVKPLNDTEGQASKLCNEIF